MYSNYSACCASLQPVGGLHVSSQPRREMNSLNAQLPSHSISYKRPSSEIGSNESDLQKKQRMQGFADPSQVLDADAYKRRHEITVVVCFLITCVVYLILFPFSLFTVIVSHGFKYLSLT